MTKYLTVEEVIVAHDAFVQDHGGLMGIRDRKLLESSIEMPKQFVFGQELHKTIYEKAAAYLFHIVKNHPFNDGNKRCGAGCTIMFLKANGIKLKFREDLYEELVIGVAEGLYDKPVISHFLEFGKIQVKTNASSRT